MSADAALRRQALDLSRSFIVQAPAGSGKTELLTQRFLKLLSRVDRPERVLAITFTRKATQEMRERVITRLRQAAADESTQHEREHERLAIELAREVLKRDRESNWRLLRNPARLRIYTIDGLCMQLLLRDPVRGATTAGLAVEEDARPLYREAVHRLLEDLGGTAAGDDATAAARDALIRLLVHLDGNAEALQKLLVDMMGVRDQWTGRIGIEGEAIREVLEDRQREEMKRFRTLLGPAELEQAMALLAELGNAVDDRQSAPARYAEACVHGVPGDEQAVRMAHLFSRVLMTQAGGARKPGGISRRLFPGLPDGRADRITELKAIYTDWCDSGAVAALERMARTPPIDLGPGRSALREDIRLVVLQALAQLRVLFAEQGKTDFQYIAEQALESLGDDEAPGQVLLDEDQRLDHVLMDEFQDTSNTQFKLLLRLLAGWEPDSGRSLFLVGDPMQSIYRFREANVGLFIDLVQRRRVGDVPLEFLQLESNFRSSGEIVDWVNSRFRDIFPKEDRHDSGAVSYASARSEVGPGGAVRLHPLAPESDDLAEARLAVDIIGQARRELDDPRIAVLARARSHLGALARELSREGIPFEAVRVDPLATRPVVRDLLAVTRALEHPADRVAWLALLRAPWCGLNLRQLHAVAGEDPRADLFERIGAELAEKGGGLADHAPLRRLHQVMQRAIALRASHGLRDRVEFCWLQLGGPCCSAGAGDLDNADDFLDLLDSVERAGSEDLLARLEEKLEELYAKSQPARLQLMTVHQAKGLEFDVVIIPGLHKGTRGGDKSLVALQEFRLGDGRDGVLMAAMPPRGEDTASVYGYLNAVEAERSAYEDQRVLYVAATRAKRQLHLLGRYKRSSKGELYATGGSFMEMLMPAFLDVIADVVPEDAAADNAVERDEEEPRPLPLLRLQGNPPLPELPALPEPAEPLELSALPTRDAVALGEALHLWLELIHDHWQNGWDAAWFEAREETLISTLRRFGASAAAIPDLLAELQRMLRLALTGETGRRIVSPEEKAESWSELVLYERKPQGFSRHIVDRLYRQADGSLVIADYKSGGQGEALGEPCGEGPEQVRANWARQLSRYRGLVEALGAGEVARTLIHQTRSDSIIDLSEESAEIRLGERDSNQA